MATLADRKDNKAKDGKSKKKGRIFVDWEKIGAVQVTPEGGKSVPPNALRTHSDARFRRTLRGEGNAVTAR